MVMALVAMLQGAPLPPQLPPELRAEHLTRPLVNVACALQRREGTAGRLEFDTVGGRAFRAETAPHAGRRVASGFRMTDQVVRIRLDELGLFAGARISNVRLYGNGGEMQSRSRLFGAPRPDWWRLAIFVPSGRGEPAVAEDAFRAVLLDADGRPHGVTGFCTVRETPQAPLTDDEIARESKR